MPQKYSVQARQLGRLAVFPVRLNRRATFEMIIDTGASLTVITPQVQAYLDLPLAKLRKGVHIPGGTIKEAVPIVVLDLIEMGEIREEKVEAYVVDIPVYGALGLNGYVRYFAEKEERVYHSGNQQPE